MMNTEAGFYFDCLVAEKGHVKGFIFTEVWTGWVVIWVNYYHSRSSRPFTIVLIYSWFFVRE